MWYAKHPYKLVSIYQAAGQHRLCLVSEDDSISKAFGCNTRPIVMQTGRTYNNDLIKVPWYRLAVMFTKKIPPSKERERKQKELVVAK